jgi:hypothetical protein
MPLSFRAAIALSMVRLENLMIAIHMAIQHQLFYSIKRPGGMCFAPILPGRLWRD